MAQQTAVEQLINYMKENFHLTDESLEKFEQAKQMEREQHGDTWLDSRVSYFGDVYIGKKQTFDQYYTLTYGNNNKTK